VQANTLDSLDWLDWLDKVERVESSRVEPSGIWAYLQHKAEHSDELAPLNYCYHLFIFLPGLFPWTPIRDFRLPVPWPGPSHNVNPLHSKILCSPKISNEFLRMK